MSVSSSVGSARRPCRFWYDGGEGPLIITQSLVLGIALASERGAPSSGVPWKPSAIISVTGQIWSGRASPSQALMPCCSRRGGGAFCFGWFF